MATSHFQKPSFILLHHLFPTHLVGVKYLNLNISLKTFDSYVLKAEADFSQKISSSTLNRTPFRITSILEIITMNGFNISTF